MFRLRRADFGGKIRFSLSRGTETSPHVFGALLTRAMVSFVLGDDRWSLPKLIMFDHCIFVFVEFLKRPCHFFAKFNQNAVVFGWYFWFPQVESTSNIGPLFSLFFSDSCFWLSRIMSEWKVRPCHWFWRKGNGWRTSPHQNLHAVLLKFSSEIISFGRTYSYLLLKKGMTSYPVKLGIQISYYFGSRHFHQSRFRWEPCQPGGLQVAQPFLECPALKFSVHQLTPQNYEADPGSGGSWDLVLRSCFLLLEEHCTSSAMARP